MLFSVAVAGTENAASAPVRAIAAPAIWRAVSGVPSDLTRARRSVRELCCRTGAYPLAVRCWFATGEMVIVLMVLTAIRWALETSLLSGTALLTST
ncbi:hypothetical protein JCM9957A_33270 [Kineosporia succinea]